MAEGGAVPSLQYLAEKIKLLQRDLALFKEVQNTLLANSTMSASGTHVQCLCNNCCLGQGQLPPPPPSN